MVRKRMSGRERREQLIEVGRELFAERGFEGTSVEAIAARSGVSKPVVYEHFGGKEGLYAVIADREMRQLESQVSRALSEGGFRERIEQAALTLLTFVETNTDGFQILVRGMAPAADLSYSSLLNVAVGQLTHILADAFADRGYDPELGELYGQALVGMVSMTAQWWLDTRELPKEVVAAHVVNLSWYGLTELQKDPQLAPETFAFVQKLRGGKQ